jgi:hypothetical protein
VLCSEKKIVFIVSLVSQLFSFLSPIARSERSVCRQKLEKVLRPLKCGRLWLLSDKRGKLETLKLWKLKFFIHLMRLDRKLSGWWTETKSGKLVCLKGREHFEHLNFTSFSLRLTKWHNVVFLTLIFDVDRWTDFTEKRAIFGETPPFKSSPEPKERPKGHEFSGKRSNRVTINFGTKRNSETSHVKIKTNQTMNK